MTMHHHGAGDVLHQTHTKNTCQYYFYYYYYHYFANSPLLWSIPINTRYCIYYIYI